MSSPGCSSPRRLTTVDLSVRRARTCATRWAPWFDRFRRGTANRLRLVSSTTTTTPRSWRRKGSRGITTSCPSRMRSSPRKRFATDRRRTVTTFGPRCWLTFTRWPRRARWIPAPPRRPWLKSSFPRIAPVRPGRRARGRPHVSHSSSGRCSRVTIRSRRRPRVTRPRG